MALAVVRSLASPRALRSQQDFEDFEQELVDQYLLSGLGAGLADSTIANERAALFEFVDFLGRPVWTTTSTDADRYLAALRTERGLAKTTVYTKALTLARFFDFLIFRYQGDVHALTGYVLEQPIDEFNKPVNPAYGEVRIPPSDAETEALFTGWRDSLAHARKYLPAVRDYMAASLWRRAGLRINETLILDVGDWRPDLGELGMVHVRHGKGSRGRGPKSRLVPAINSVDALMHWWFTDIRHQFGDDWADPSAPLLPSERRDRVTGRCGRAGASTLREGLAAAVETWLPAWSSRMSPHVLRHYCASSLYLRGLDLKAIQDLLGHEWLSTTTRYIHVPASHVEQAWLVANDRVQARLGLETG
jgi:site-specific recombinase XerD